MNVATAWDCELPNMSPVVSARVEHGSVSHRDGDGPRCGRPSMRLTSILDTPAPGLKTQDKLYVLASSPMATSIRTLTILVK